MKTIELALAQYRRGGITLAEYLIVVGEAIKFEQEISQDNDFDPEIYLLLAGITVDLW